MIKAVDKKIKFDVIYHKKENEIKIWVLRSILICNVNKECSVCKRHNLTWNIGERPNFIWKMSQPILLINNTQLVNFAYEFLKPPEGCVIYT